MVEAKKRPAPRVSDEIVNQYHGQVASVDLNGLTVDVQVRDVRFRYGHIDVLVTPLSGSGDKWILADRITLA